MCSTPSYQICADVFAGHDSGRDPAGGTASNTFSAFRSPSIAPGRLFRGLRPVNGTSTDRSNSDRLISYHRPQRTTSATGELCSNGSETLEYSKSIAHFKGMLCFYHAQRPNGRCPAIQRRHRSGTSRPRLLPSRYSYRNSRIKRKEGATSGKK